VSALLSVKSIKVIEFNKQGEYMKLSGLKKSIIGTCVMVAVPLFVQAQEKPPEIRVPIEAARKTARAEFAGKIQDEELEFEGGKWIYSFDLKSDKDSRVHEVHVDAVSGKFLDKHTETAADEKKEAQEDAYDKESDSN
jgi:uncharacterized membrane protein YkoI